MAEFGQDPRLQEIALALLEQMDAYVETGIRAGRTIAWVAERTAKPCVGCEPGGSFGEAREVCGKRENVTLHNTTSQKMLLLLPEDIEALWFLDAHGFGDWEWPLHDELDHLAGLDRFAAIIHNYAVPTFQHDVWKGAALNWAYIADYVPEGADVYIPDYDGKGRPGWALLTKGVEIDEDWPITAGGDDG